MARNRVLRVQFQGRGHMSRVSQALEGMDNAVGIAPVVPELGIVGACLLYTSDAADE